MPIDYLVNLLKSLVADIPVTEHSTFLLVSAAALLLAFGVFSFMVKSIKKIILAAIVIGLLSVYGTGFGLGPVYDVAAEQVTNAVDTLREASGAF